MAVVSASSSSGPSENDNQSVPDCSSDPAAALKDMFVDRTQGERIVRGQDPVERPVFLKPHGTARGTLTVRADLPEELRVGFLESARQRPEGLTAWVRFSSDTVPSRPDLLTTLGVGVKLFGVPGPKLLDGDGDGGGGDDGEGEGDVGTQDLLLQNHDVFFVDTAQDMCEFTRAGVVHHDYESYLRDHPVTRRILDDMAKAEASVLTATYWGVLPYAFGTERFVKYKLTPAGCAAADQAATPPDENPGYLGADLAHRLAAGEAAFDLSVQFRTDDEAMPLDRATVRWEETASAPVPVARLTLARQDVRSRGQAAYGANLAFNPWHSLAAHRPVGSLAEARATVYKASADRRRHANGIPAAEPGPARPPASEPAGRDTRIVRAAIHPAIGVARVGDSADEFFLAPETEDAPPLPTGSYKDPTGALKRQAARFRIYGYNAAGEPVAELTADNAEMRWTVHVANKKAEWYQFQLALDIPEAAQADESQLRNPLVAAPERSKLLVIDPGARSVRGRNRVGGSELRFDTGKFMDIPVYLGELRTDEAGRLIFLGGRGIAESVDSKEADTFANNDGWYDDISDGPVTAEVRVDGRTLPVEPAWVVVGPPNYAPELKSVRTLYDLLRDAFVTAGALSEPDKVSFTHDILPILRRLCDLQWVNQGLATLFGHGGREHFLAPDLLAALADPGPRHEELRRQISKTMRNPDRDGTSQVPWPPVYGDAMSLPPVSPRQHLALSPLQTRLLARWARGDFVPDHTPGAETAPPELDRLPIAARPAALDRAALSFCLADAFHPGCEITWPMRHTTLYSAPFRIHHRSKPEPSYGRVLTPQAALAYDGPLYGQRPGGLTRWMAVPWQTDTASCRSGYERRYDPYLPTFWPARVPNHVLTEEDYRITVDTTRPRDERLAAFARRSPWDRWLPKPYKATINAMVKDFGRLGLVERRPGVTDDLLPAEMFVESEVSFPAEPAPPRGRNLLSLHVPLAADERLRDAVLATAVALAEEPDEELSAGYIEKVARFPGNR